MQGMYYLSSIDIIYSLNKFLSIFPAKTADPIENIPKHKVIPIGIAAIIIFILHPLSFNYPGRHIKKEISLLT